MNYSVDEIFKYRCENNCLRFGIPFITTVVVKNQTGDTIYKNKAVCTFSEEVGYNQLTLSIDWKISDAEAKRLGLYGSYNTNYQEFRYDDMALIITNNRQPERVIYIMDRPE